MPKIKIDLTNYCICNAVINLVYFGMFCLSVCHIKSPIIMISTVCKESDRLCFKYLKSLNETNFNCTYFVFELYFFFHFFYWPMSYNRIFYPRLALQDLPKINFYLLFIQVHKSGPSKPTPQQLKNMVSNVNRHCLQLWPFKKIMVTNALLMKCRFCKFDMVIN